MPRKSKPPSKIIGGWTVGAHAGDTRKAVWHVVGPKGVAGVMKHHPRPSASSKESYTYKRFRLEVQGMRALPSNPGVLPLLDSDANITNPEWMVTEKAELLVDHLGLTPDFREVIESFRDLSKTLADLERGHGLAHRDLKPDNLFWLNGRAVVGDFGIATWQFRPALTLPMNKIGPLYFLAPEVLEPTSGVNAHRADVFSLAKSLWAVATSQRYPPQGILSIHRGRATSLWSYGGAPAIELARLLEVATEDSPHFRPTMAEFSLELDLWLGQHSSAPRPASGRLAWPMLYQSYEADMSELERINRNLNRLLHPLRDLFSGESQTDEAGSPKGDEHLDFSGGDPDWEPDWSVSRTLSWNHYPHVRVVAFGFGSSADEITYLTEWQHKTATGEWAATHPTIHGTARQRLPSDRDVQARLVDELKALNPGAGAAYPPAPIGLTRIVRRWLAATAHRWIDALLGPAGN
jgi:serine/threonine protein kinase